MFKMFFKNSLRLIAKDKFSNCLNILGLSIGIASFFLLISYVNFEFSYDRFHKNYKDIYRLQINWKKENKENKWALTAPGLGNIIKQDFPEVISSVRIMPSNNITAFYGEKKFRASNILYTDSSFFSVFTFKFLKGSPEKTFSEQNSIVLTKSIAKKIFGNEDPLNKVLTFYDKNGKFITTVKGVIEDIPENSHIKFDYLISFNVQSQLRGNNFLTDLRYLRCFTYLFLKPGTNYHNLELKFPKLIKEHKINEIRKCDDITLLLQQIKDIHLHSNLEWDTKNGNAVVVYILLFSSILVMLLAWINFINISITKSIDRIKEIGIRKILGSSKTFITIQLLFDSFIQNLISLILSFIWLFIMFYILNTLGINVLISLSVVFVLLFFLFFLIISSLFLGIYPAVVLSNTKLASIVKGTLSFSPKGALFMQCLSGFQFLISTVILAITLTINDQVNFMINYDKGIDINNIIVIKTPMSNDNYINKIRTFRNELLKYPEIKNISHTTSIPSEEVPINNVNNIKKLENGNDQGYSIASIDIDNEYIPTYNLKLLAGKNFSNNYLNEKRNLLINESALKLLGYVKPDNAINSKLVIDTIYTIIGVVKDFHQESLKRNKIPILFSFADEGGGYYCIKYTSDQKKVLNILKRHWEEIFPVDALDYFLLEDFYNSNYKTDIRFKQVFTLLTILSLIISCIGIFGLSYFTSVSRTKEVAIRKVLCAKKGTVLLLFVKRYVGLILITSIIGVPSSLFIINKILENYVYKINISVFTVIVPILIILLITLLTIFYHIYKVASTSPAKCLKSDNF